MLSVLNVIQLDFVAASFEVTEEVIVRDLVYVFQGIEGKYIKYSHSEDAFRLDSQVGWFTHC